MGLQLAALQTLQPKWFSEDLKSDYKFEDEFKCKILQKIIKIELNENTKSFCENI